ncbi:hypothetical protein Q1695_011761 [Nippostrongylus brasiliensis]|nr:hypothetical protein Q1695_011761 [Nippostrongylus brasiliensis]
MTLFDQGSAPDCIGGVINNDLLKRLAHCSVVNGSLQFLNMTVMSAFTDSLRSVTRLNGLLKIENSPIFIEFALLPNLKVISNSGAGPALSVRRNVNLRFMDFPSLRSLQSKNSPKVVIEDNPLLSLTGKMYDLLISMPEEEKHISVVDVAAARHPREAPVTNQSTKAVSRSPVTSAPGRSVLWKPDYLVLLVLVATILLLFCLMCYWRKKSQQPSALTYRRSDIVPPSNYVLRPKSRLILSYLCEVDEQELLWPVKKTCNCDRFHHLEKKHDHMVKRYMLPIAKNGSIPNDMSSIRNQELVFERLREMLRNKRIVVIGTNHDPSCVVPLIPIELGSSHTFESKECVITLGLKKIHRSSGSHRVYTYDFCTNIDRRLRNGTVNVVYYKWAPLDLNVNADEMFRLVQYTATEKKSICVSTRHKEVFSLLHFLYCFIVKMETPILLYDAFKLHTMKCNGSIMDRTEMLFVMKFLLIWAAHSASIPSRLHNAAHTWLNIYDKLVSFQKRHRNVLSFHPLHLRSIPREIVADTVINGGCTPSPLSNRKDAIMRDRFIIRRKLGTHVKTDLERQAERGKLRRLEQQICELSGNNEAKRSNTSSRSRRARPKLGGYWATKETQIRELKAKRLKNKPGEEEKIEDDASDVSQSTKNPIEKCVSDDSPNPDSQKLDLIQKAQLMLSRKGIRASVGVDHQTFSAFNFETTDTRPTMIIRILLSLSPYALCLPSNDSPKVLLNNTAFGPPQDQVPGQQYSFPPNNTPVTKVYLFDRPIYVRQPFVLPQRDLGYRKPDDERSSREGRGFLVAPSATVDEAPDSFVLHDDYQSQFFIDPEPKQLPSRPYFNTYINPPAPEPNYAAPPKYPLPQCYTNDSGFMCCNQKLEQIMKDTFAELVADEKWNTCNVQRIANKLQNRTQCAFNTDFEVLAGIGDFASKTHFYSDLICKIEAAGRFMLAYATPNRHHAAPSYPVVETSSTGYL